MRIPTLLACGLLIAACKPASPDAAKQDTPKPTRTEPAPAPAPVQLRCDESATQALAVLEQLDAWTTADSIDVIAVQDQVRGATLEWLGAADLALGRMSQDKAQDVDLITQVLAVLPERELDGQRSDLALIATQLRAVAFLDMRRMLGDVADERVQGPEAMQAWTQARCLWNESLRKLATRADALPEHAGEDWADGIALAFEDGLVALAEHEVGDGESLARIKAAKQRAEKGMYAVFYRLIIADAEAHGRVASSEALGLLDALEDRLADRNGPGLERMRRAFNGDPAQVEPAKVERELAVAFAKRARKYCDKAVLGAEYGTPGAIGETWEGVVYTRVILPDMRERMADRGFDGDAYMDDWDSYLRAVESGDAENAAAISPRLVEWNCTYQTLLGIAECSSSSNEAQ